MNLKNRIQKLETKITGEDCCTCFAEQTKAFVNKIYGGEAYADSENPSIPTRSGVICQVCGKPVKNIFDAQTVETINEMYEETVSQ